MEKLAYITGSGRSGSTLLDMLLSTNSDIAALGEVHRYSISFNKITNAHLCTCGETIEECPFWTKVSREIQKKGKAPEELKTAWEQYEKIPENPKGDNIIEYLPPKHYLQRANFFNILLSARLSFLFPYAKFISKKIRQGDKIFKDSWDLYECVAGAQDAKVVVDGSKTPGRLMGLCAYKRKPVYVIYLCRDGRAVTHARMKRQGVSMEYAAKAWVLEHKKIFRALRAYNTSRLFIKYEALCKNTDQVLSTISAFLDVDDCFDKGGFRSESHSLGGNPMRKRTQERKIKLDEKWKIEMSKDDQNTFNKIAGAMNLKLGYE